MLFGQNLLMGCNSELSALYERTTAQTQNVQLLTVLYNYWSNIAVTRYKWSNLPDSVDERLLNIGLYLYGQVAFFQHETLGLIALPCNPGNQFNLLYQPINITTFGYGATFQLSAGEFEIVRLNPTGTPLAWGVLTLVYRITDCLRSIDVMCQRMKRPFVFLCDEKEKMTLLNLFKRVKDNEEIILGMKDYGLNQKSIEIAPTPTTGSLNDLWETYKMYETMLYTMMGIDNRGYEKKERLLVDEVNANNMVIEMATEVSTKEIEMGVARVNKRFDTNISMETLSLLSYDSGVMDNG